MSKQALCLLQYESNNFTTFVISSSLSIRTVLENVLANVVFDPRSQFRVDPAHQLLNYQFLFSLQSNVKSISLLPAVNQTLFFFKWVPPYIHVRHIRVLSLKYWIYSLLFEKENINHSSQIVWELVAEKKWAWRHWLSNVLRSKMTTWEQVECSIVLYELIYPTFQSCTNSMSPKQYFHLSLAWSDLFREQRWFWFASYSFEALASFK